MRRAQVYVEALIAEMTAEKAAEFGVQWQDLSGSRSTDNSTRAFGGTNFGNARPEHPGHRARIRSGRAAASTSASSGAASRFPGIGEMLNLGVLVRALETDNNANILSTPTLLTLDNEEARIVIGQNVPFITGQYALSRRGDDADAVPDDRAARRRAHAADQAADLRRRHRPAADLPGSLERAGHVTNPAGVITNKRAVESTVLVDDGEIVVIGGLIQDSVKDGVEKVPVLGDIPLLGGALPVQHARAQQDEPDGVPAPDGAARRRSARRR